jgi:pimeloyl-ACP methyl ester carboxylesterase
MSVRMLAVGLLVFLCGSSLRAEHGSIDSSSALMIERQGSFFIGGTVHHADALSPIETGPFTRAGETTTGQMYVQYQIPVEAKHLPIVLIHGCCLSGQSYETTPDGRMGWNEYFLRAGRPVYLVDQVGRGRSGFDATNYNAVRLGIKPATEQAPILMINHELAWTYFRIGPKFGTAFPDTQFPVNAVDAFYRMWIPDLNPSLPRQNPTYAGLAALAQKLAGAVLVGHSESFMFPEQAALLDPLAVKGIISLESGSQCASPFTQQELATLAKIPILVVFGDHLTDVPAFASQWSRSIAQCRDFAAAIQKEGGNVTFLHLPDVGIHGNTHMFMLDRNNLRIADLLLRWIDSHVERRAK